MRHPPHPARSFRVNQAGNEDNVALFTRHCQPRFNRLPDVEVPLSLGSLHADTLLAAIRWCVVLLVDVPANKARFGEAGNIASIHRPVSEGS